MHKITGLMLCIGLVFTLGPSLGWQSASTEECTVSLKPDQSIQQAIGQVSEGAVICLSAGTWNENLLITKPLTLRGAGRDQTVLQGTLSERIVLQIGSPELIALPEPIKVRIEGVAITGGRGCASYPLRCALGVSVAGHVEAMISNSQIFDNDGAGIGVCCAANVTVISSQIFQNDWYGVGVSTPEPFGPLPVVINIQDSEIFENSLQQFENYAEAGVWLGGSAQANISNTSIRNNTNGLFVTDSSQATITNSTIAHNSEAGLVLGYSAQVAITDSSIARNGGVGIGLAGSVQAAIKGNRITGNGTHGVVVVDAAQAEIRENIIEGNAGCGIISQCSREVSGARNSMSGNGADLCGNLCGSLRTPLMEATEEEITYPDKRYTSLQEAVDALLPGGKLILQTRSYGVGVTIVKEMQLEAMEKAEMVLEAVSGEAPILSSVGEADLELIGLKVTGGFFGLLLGANAQARITGSSISRGMFGIYLMGSAQAKIIDSTISGSEHGGIYSEGLTQVVISDSTISGGRYGIGICNSARAEMTHSTIFENREHGIILTDSAQATIEGNIIGNNEGYGIALYQQPCYDTDEVFTGHVLGKANVIPGPGEPDGNGKGAVCPPDLEFLMTEEGGEYP